MVNFSQIITFNFFLILSKTGNRSDGEFPFRQCASLISLKLEKGFDYISYLAFQRRFLVQHKGSKEPIHDHKWAFRIRSVSL